MENLQQQLELAEAQSRINKKDSARQQALYMAESINKGTGASVNTLLSDADKIYDWLTKEV